MRIQDLPHWPPSVWAACISPMGKTMPDYSKAVIESVRVDKNTVLLSVKENDTTFSGSFSVGSNDLAVRVCRALSKTIGKTIMEAGQVSIPDQ